MFNGAQSRRENRVIPLRSGLAPGDWAQERPDARSSTPGLFAEHVCIALEHMRATADLVVGVDMLVSGSVGKSLRQDERHDIRFMLLMPHDFATVREMPTIKTGWKMMWSDHKSVLIRR